MTRESHRAVSLLRGLRLAAFATCCALLSDAAFAVAKPADPTALRPVAIQDLEYGEVLYYFYQGDYFGALTRLTAAMSRGRLRHHADDAELLLGSLYLSLGQHREAGVIFARMLERPGLPAGIRSRAHFYLGKVRYQRGYFADALASLEAPDARALDENLETERRMLLGQTLLALGRNEDAARALDFHTPNVIQQSYVAYNRGVALIRAGHFDQGIADLRSVGQTVGKNNELDAMRDKANLALGYAMLQANRGGEALAALERVRLQSPMSTRALLGAGWAESAAGHYDNALVPWLELHDRNLLDPAVQESYLAVPYAYARLGANDEASAAYERAIEEFSSESDRLQGAIESIRHGGIEAAVRVGDARAIDSWYAKSSSLANLPEAHYLYPLLALNEFEAGVRNYHTLRFLDHTLEQWASAIDAFGDMIETREQQYAERAPNLIDHIDHADIEGLRKRRMELEARLARAVADGDVAVLGTPRERELWTQVERVEAGLGDATDQPDGEDAAQKLHLAKGVLYWQMNEAFAARAWAERKELRETAQLMRELESRFTRVRDERTSTPQRNANFRSIVADLGPRIAQTRERIRQMQAADVEFLGGLAVQELAAQKTRIDAYAMQAKYALATIYDRAAAIEDKKAGQGATPPPAPEERP